MGEDFRAQSKILKKNALETWFIGLRQRAILRQSPAIEIISGAFVAGNAVIRPARRRFDVPGFQTPGGDATTTPSSG